MFLLLKKKKLFIVIFLFFILISFLPPKNENKVESISNNFVKNQSINIKNLRINLYKADKELTPKLNRNNDGSYFYSFIKKPGESEISLEEIKKRVLLGPDFYQKERDDVINLLKKINQLKINNKLENIESGALGLWIPSKDTIIIDYRAIEMGSPIFLNILSHEAIHVAQSCYSGSRKNFPERIGLPLEYSTDIKLNLSHNLYSNKSKEVMNLEREAFTYSKVEGVAMKLLNHFC